MCRNMATPTAVALADRSQNCFTQVCPTGAGQVCEPDAMGMLEHAVQHLHQQLVLAATSASCSPSQNPSECHQCVPQADACTADM